ncbi:unnamed protein product [Cunninghamella blakesleeana]
MTILSDNNNNEEENKKANFIIRKISSEDNVALLPQLQHTKSVVANYAESIRRQRSDSFVHSHRIQQQPTNNKNNTESRILSIYNNYTTDIDTDNMDFNKDSNQDNSMLHAKILSAATKPSSLTNTTPTLHINTSISYNNNNININNYNNDNSNNNNNNKDTGAILEGILIRRAIRPASLLPHTKEDVNNTSSSPASESPFSLPSESPEEPKSLSISISSSTLTSTTTKSSPSITTPSPPLPPPIHPSSTTSSLSNESMLQHPWEPPSLLSNHLNNNNSNHNNHILNKNNHHHNIHNHNNSNYNHMHASQSNHSISSSTNDDSSSSLKQPSSLFKRLANRQHHGLNLTRDDMLSPENILYPPSTPTLDQETELDKYGFQKATQWLSLETYRDFEKQYQPILDRRRLKWQQLLDENEQKLPDRSTQIKRYIRKGIPSHLRGRVWLHYSGAEAKMDANPGVYEKFLKRAMEMGDDSEFADLIERDLHRTFPDNIQFSRAVALARSASTSSKSIPTPPLSSTPSSSTTTDDNHHSSLDDFIPPAIDVLRRVLRVFSVYCPSVGYCQSLNYLVGMLLLFMKEEEAFWCLVTIVQNILPAGVYDVTMEGSSIDQTVLMMLLHERMPQFWYRLTDKSFWEAESDGVSMPTITLVTSHWFLTLFINILPTESMLRIWDCFFYEGSNALFRVSLALFKMVEPCILELNDPLEIFQVVQNFPKRMIDCQLLIDCAYRKYATFTDISNEELDRRREICRELRKARRSMTPSELAANRSKYDTTTRKRWKLIVNPSVSHHVLRK